VTTVRFYCTARDSVTATMVVWSKTGERTFYNVTVDLNLEPLRKILKDSFRASRLPRIARAIRCL